MALSDREIVGELELLTCGVIPSLPYYGGLQAIS